MDAHGSNIHAPFEVTQNECPVCVNRFDQKLWAVIALFNIFLHILLRHELNQETYGSSEHGGEGEVLFWPVGDQNDRWGQDVAESSQSHQSADAYSQ
jgi:hypothetical protein